MNRREFLKRLSTSGLVLGSPAFMPAHANTSLEEQDHFWITVNVSGGWDTTLFCDPKSADTGMTRVTKPPLSPENGGPMRLNACSDQLSEDLQQVGEAVSQRFLDRFAQKTLVVNGINVQTTGHTTGYRTVWSGSHSKFPTIGAVISGTKARNLPLSYFSSGGYEETGGLVSLSRNPASSSNNPEFTETIINRFTKTFNSIADSNIAFDANGNEQGKYFSDEVNQLLQDAKSSRLEELSEQTLALPRAKQLITQLGSMRALDTNSYTELKAWIDNLRNPDNDIRTTKLHESYFDDRANANANNFRERAAFAIAAFKSGMTVSANIGCGGFDTHVNNDEGNYPRLLSLMDGLDYLWDALEFAGLANKTTVMVASELARTPHYNDENGKDHWNITSMMFMGDRIQGNRVVGATDNKLEPLKVHPQTLATLQPDSPDWDEGIFMTNEHIHDAMRRLADVESSDAARQFSIDTDQQLRLFDPLT